MRRDLFHRGRLRASYRCIPMDAVLALLEGTDSEDQFVEAYGRAPRLRPAQPGAEDEEAG